MRLSAMIGALLRSCLLAAVANQQSCVAQPKTSCFYRGISYAFCCNRELSPAVTSKCWNAYFYHPHCCQLTPWFDHEKELPLLSEPVVPVLLTTNPEFRPSSDRAQNRLCLHQGRDGRLQPPGALLWPGAYQFLRWFECFADRPPSAWVGRRYIEFGAGIGALGLMAVLNGAYVTLVIDHDARDLIETNIAMNLPRTHQHRVRICKLDWTAASLESSLQALALCEGQDSLPIDKYSIVVKSSARVDAPLLRLMGELGTCDALVLLQLFCDEKAYTTTLEPLLSDHFVRTGVWTDDGLTIFRKNLLMEFAVKKSRCPVLDVHQPKLQRGPACSNQSAIPYQKRWHDPQQCEAANATGAASLARDWTVQGGLVPPKLRPSVAVCVTGLERTLLSHPVVSTFHAHVVEPLSWIGYAVDTYMSIVDVEGKPGLAGAVARAYRPAGLRILQGEVFRVPVPQRCRSPSFRVDDDKVLLQFHGIRDCYQQVEAVERMHGVRYSWMYRLRSDTVYFTDLVPVGMSEDHAYVPFGGMNKFGVTQCMNDHLFFCPRALCRPYFHLLELWESPHCSPESHGNLCPVGQLWANFTEDPATPVIWPAAGVSVPDGLHGPPAEPYVLPSIPQSFCYNPDSPATDAFQKWRRKNLKLVQSGWQFIKFDGRINSQWYFFARYGGVAACFPPQAPSDCCGRLREIKVAYAIARTGTRIDCKVWLHDWWPAKERSRRYLRMCNDILAAWKRGETSAEDPAGGRKTAAYPGLS